MGEIKFIRYKKRIEKGKTVLETRPTPYYYEKDGTMAPIDEILNREEELCQKEASGKILSLDEQIELELISKIPFAHQKHLLATITIDAEIDNVTVRGRNDAIRRAEEKAGIKHPYHFVWIEGAEKKKGIIEFPWDGYSKVYIVKGTYDKPEIIFLEEGKGYEIKDGKTFVYMDGFSGAGTDQEPFEVATAEDLSKVGTGTDGWNLDSYYIQTADIDLTGYSNWTKIGTYADRFVGSYDGAGFEIKNLIIQDSAAGCGLFAYLGVGGHLSNIHLRNVSSAGYQRTGSLVGSNYGTIERCSATGSVSATSSYCGGLVGVNESGGNIFESWCICDVTSSYSYGYLGGFTARNYGVITDCYAQGSVTGANELGGFLGRNFATIERCYAAVQVIASNPMYVGGFCGYDQGAALRACYYDSQVAGRSDSSKGSPRTTAQMKGINTFVGWDISLKSVFDPQSPTIWFIDNGNDYPRLGWEFVPPPQGGSESTVTISASGVGIKTSQGGSEASAIVSVEGRGIKVVAAGSETGVIISASGAGIKIAQGGNKASASVSTSSAGIKIAQGYSSAGISVTAKGRFAVRDIEWVPLGTFWSLDWDSPDDTLEATVTARDRMEMLRKSTFQTSQVLQNKSLYELAEIVLQDAGLTSDEYIIDTALQNIVVPYSWFNPVSHREALRLIAEAGLAAAFQNRDGKIQIESFLISGDEPVLEITEDDYFPPLRAPSRQDQVANEIIVDTQPLRPATTPEEVYKSNESVTIPASTTKTITAFYNSPPVIEATASLDNPPAGVSITEATYYGWGASIKIQNTNATGKQVTLVIQGKPLTVQNKERAIARDEASITENGVLRYEFPANPLVQTLDQAQAIADALLASVKDPRRDIEVDWRGNPALLLGDRVTVKGKDYHVIRQELEWTGVLSARLTGRKVI